MSLEAELPIAARSASLRYVTLLSGLEPLI
jgi:hypothetical protein